jgi:hypothetical protein
MKASVAVWRAEPLLALSAASVERASETEIVIELIS